MPFGTDKHIYLLNSKDCLYIIYFFTHPLLFASNRGWYSCKGWLIFNSLNFVLYIHFAWRKKIFG